MHIQSIYLTFKIKLERYFCKNIIKSSKNKRKEKVLDMEKKTLENKRKTHELQMLWKIKKGRCNIGTTPNSFHLLILEVSKIEEEE